MLSRGILLLLVGFDRVDDLEDLGDVDIALGPHLEEETCDRFRLKTIIRLECRWYTYIASYLLFCTEHIGLYTVQELNSCAFRILPEFVTSELLSIDIFAHVMETKQI